MAIDAGPFSDTDAQPAPELPLTLYASKRTAMLALLGSLVFVALGCWMLTASLANDPSAQQTRTFGFAGIILFGSGAVVSLYILIWKLRIVTLDETGIFITGHKRWIAWNEISDIDFVNRRAVFGFFGVGPREIEWIGIFLKDTSAYYALWGPISRKLMSMTERKLGTPILINCSFLLPVEPDTLIA